MVICLERGADCLYTVQPMPLPSRNLIIARRLITIHNGFTFYLSDGSLPRLYLERGLEISVVADR